MLFRSDDYAVEDIPADLLEKAKQARHDMIETLSENDDVCMEKYLEGIELTDAEIIAGIRRATISAKLTPVLTGSAFKNKGVQPMLDAVVRYLPSPLDVESIVGTDMNNSEIEIIRHPDNKEPARHSHLIL